MTNDYIGLSTIVVAVCLSTISPDEIIAFSLEIDISGTTLTG